MLDLTLTRIRQLRDVIFTRKGEERDDLIDIHERSTRAILQAVHGAAGNGPGMKAAAGWEMYPGARVADVGPQLPNTDKVLGSMGGVLGGGTPQFSWEQVEALAEEMGRG